MAPRTASCATHMNADNYPSIIPYSTISPALHTTMAGAWNSVRTECYTLRPVTRPTKNLHKTWARLPARYCGYKTVASLQLTTHTKMQYFHTATEIHRVLRGTTRVLCGRRNTAVLEPFRDLT